MQKILNHRHSALRFFIGIVLGLIVLIVLTIVWYARSFIIPAGVSISYVRDTITQGMNRAKEFQDHKLTFLILGLDNRNDTLESTLLTDTIIIASLDTGQKSLTMIPIPRDLWVGELKTKVNSLYFYGDQREDDTSISYITTELTKITGQTLPHYIVMDYNKLPQLIDMLGGVKVQVDKSFTDNQYPNPEYIHDQTKPQYITVNFENGTQMFSGARALQFVRSRHSEDESGTDAGRSSRQLVLINGLINQVTSKQMLLDPDTLGTLYRYWHDEIDTNLTDEDLVALSAALKTKYIDVRSISIPTSSDTDTRSILVNPPVQKYGLWVWEPVDPTWEELQDFMENNL